MRSLVCLLALPLFAATTVIDCGSATDSNFAGGTVWVIPSPPAGLADATLRYGPSFSYRIPVEPNYPYIVTLRFLEPTVTAPAQRVFSVAINNQYVVTNLDLVASAGFMKPLSRSAVVTSADGELLIAFLASVRSAVISSIEITPLFAP